MSCRDMELLYRQRAVFDSEHSWKWLGEAERWGHLAQKETASRFKEIGPMAMGPNTIHGGQLDFNLSRPCASTGRKRSVEGKVDCVAIEAGAMKHCQH
jgi:hypothetical protein